MCISIQQLYTLSVLKIKQESYKKSHFRHQPPTSPITKATDLPLTYCCVTANYSLRECSHAHAHTHTHMHKSHLTLGGHTIERNTLSWGWVPVSVKSPSWKTPLNPHFTPIYPASSHLRSVAKGHGVKGLRRRTSTWLRWRLPAWLLPGCCFHSFNWRKGCSVASFKVLRKTAWWTQSYLGGVEAKPGNKLMWCLHLNVCNKLILNRCILSFELKHYGLMDVYISGVSLNLLMPMTPKYGKGCIHLSIHPSIKTNFFKCMLPKLLTSFYIVNLL